MKRKGGLLILFDALCNKRPTAYLALYISAEVTGRAKNTMNKSVERWQELPSMVKIGQKQAQYHLGDNSTMWSTWCSELLRGSRKLNAHTIEKEHRFVLVWNRTMHYWTVAVTFNILVHSL